MTNGNTMGEHLDELVRKHEAANAELASNGLLCRVVAWHYRRRFAKRLAAHRAAIDAQRDRTLARYWDDKLWEVKE